MQDIEPKKHLPRNPRGINQYPGNRGKAINIRLPKEMEAELRERAKILDTSLTNVIEVALDFYFRIEKIDQDL